MFQRPFSKVFLSPEIFLCFVPTLRHQILKIFRQTDVAVLDQCCPAPKVSAFGDCDSKFYFSPHSGADVQPLVYYEDDISIRRIFL
jgi:hypothetical protein